MDKLYRYIRRSSCSWRTLRGDFPLSLGLFLTDLVLVVRTRIKNKELWLYREARTCYLGARYGMALERIEEIIRLRPDMENFLKNEKTRCRILAGHMRDTEGP